MFHLAGRVRTVSETSSESGDLVRKISTGVGYDVDGKFSFTKVRKGIVSKTISMAEIRGVRIIPNGALQLTPALLWYEDTVHGT